MMWLKSGWTCQLKHFKIKGRHVQPDFNHIMSYTPTYTLLVIYLYPLQFDKCQML